MRLLSVTCGAGVCLGLSVLVFPSVVHGQLSSTKAPETFYAEARTLGEDAGASATVTIRIMRYTPEKDLMAMQDALKINGYKGFLLAIRVAPDVGSIEMNGRKVAVRWARQQPKDKGRTISVVGEAPLFFVGGGAVDAKSRNGFELAIILLDLDPIGLGSGSMAPAARVRPGGETGVQIDDYAYRPVKLVSVRKSYQ